MKQIATASTLRRQDSRDVARGLLVELLDDLAGLVDPLADLEPVAAPDVRRGVVGVGVPEVVAGAAADLDHVAEALRRHHRRGRQPARDERVRGDGRAVAEERHVGEVDAGLRDTAQHAVDRVGRRGHLRDVQHAVARVEHADVGERPADVHRDHRSGHTLHALRHFLSVDGRRACPQAPWCFTRILRSPSSGRWR
jgi:hypothetical protein